MMSEWTVAKARQAISIARAYPSTSNVAAARSAVAAVMQVRADKASGPVVKVGGHSANGHGYNPYRAAGKFAPGPHKEQPKVGKPRASVEPGQTGKSKRIGEPDGKAKASSEKAKRVREAKDAVAKAKKEPTPDNIAAAKAQISEARGGSHHEKPAEARSAESHQTSHKPAEHEPAPVHQPEGPAAGHTVGSEKEFRNLQDEFRAKLTPDEIKSSIRYSREYYIDINRHLRGDERYAKLQESESSMIPHLDSMLAKGRLTEPLVTHRASQFDPGTPGHALKPGDTFREPGYMSTSYRDTNINRFGNVHFVITSPPGTKIAANPSSAGEGEMLAARGSTLRITHREDHSDGRVTLHATVDSQD